MRNNRQATIYLINKKFILYPSVKVKEGDWRGLSAMIEPVEIYDNISDLISNIERILTYCDQHLTTVDARSKLEIALQKKLKLAGIRSERAFTKKVLSVNVTEQKKIVTFTPTEREKKGYFGFLPEKKQTAPLSDPKSLVEALQKAIAACRVEEENPPKTKEKRAPYIPIENGIAISKRMLPLNEEGYQKSRTLKAVLSRYLNELVKYTGKEKDPSKSKKITARQLTLVVPSFNFTEPQQAIIEEFKQKAKECGVVVIVSDSY